MIKLLVLTTLYPNREQPRHGIFVETRLQQLLESNEVEAEVVAPVPWFPFTSSRFGDYSVYAKVPRHEIRHGIKVHHPRYLVIPKIGMILTPFFLALAFFFSVRCLKKEGLSYDLVDSHYYYPDGVAVAMLKRFLNAPISITARGSDINLIPGYRIPRKLIVWAAKSTSVTIAVSDALRQELLKLGVEEQKIHVFRNGVDLNFFRPLDQQKCKDKWGVSGPVLASVGNLIEMKGHHLVIEALEELPEYSLVVVGEGEYKQRLHQLVHDRNLEARVRFLGNLDQKELIEIYGAADILVLASSREGMPNVVLEAVACGTPVVATRVGGTPELIQSSDMGVLVENRTGAAIAAGVKSLSFSAADSGTVRARAKRWSWKVTIDGIISVFGRLITGYGSDR